MRWRKRKPPPPYAHASARGAYVICDGLRFEVRRIGLIEGCFQIQASRFCETSGKGWATVFGEDGHGVYQHPSEVEWPSGHVVMFLPIRITQAWPEGQKP